MRARHYVGSRHLVAERTRREERLRPSARDLFPVLRERLLASRAVVAVLDKGTPEQVIVFGAPTFRNVIDPKTGEHR